MSPDKDGDVAHIARPYNAGDTIIKHIASRILGIDPNLEIKEMLKGGECRDLGKEIISVYRV